MDYLTLKKKVALYVCTGDSRGPALEVAKQLGIPGENVKSGMKPADKIAFVQELKRQQQGDSTSSGEGENKNARAVLMVGDGVNDAGALAVADIGVAVGKNVNITLQAADIVITSASEGASNENDGEGGGGSNGNKQQQGDLSRLALLIQLSAFIVYIIRLNFLWAFLFNVIGIPLA